MMDFPYIYKKSIGFKSHIVKRQAGFTLVDILVGLALASVLMAAVVSLLPPWEDRIRPKTSPPMSRK